MAKQKSAMPISVASSVSNPSSKNASSMVAKNPLPAYQTQAAAVIKAQPANTTAAAAQKVEKPANVTVQTQVANHEPKKNSTTALAAPTSVPKPSLSVVAPKPNTTFVQPPSTNQTIAQPPVTNITAVQNQTSAQPSAVNTTATAQNQTIAQPATPNITVAQPQPSNVSLPEQPAANTSQVQNTTNQTLTDKEEEDPRKKSHEELNEIYKEVMEEQDKEEEEKTKMKEKEEEEKQKAAAMEIDSLMQYVNSASDEHQSQKDKKHILDVFTKNADDDDDAPKGFISKKKAVLSQEQIFDDWEVDLTSEQEQKFSKHFSQIWDQFAGEGGEIMQAEKAVDFMQELMQMSQEDKLKVIKIKTMQQSQPQNNTL